LTEFLIKYIFKKTTFCKKKKLYLRKKCKNMAVFDINV